MSKTENTFDRWKKRGNDKLPTFTARDYVVSIETKNCVNKKTEFGNGIIVGDLLITAGHVVKNGIGTSFNFNIDGQNIKLDSLEKLYECYIKDINEYDLAIYRVPDISSPYVLSSKEPVNGQILRSESIDTAACKTTVCNAEVKIDGESQGLYFRVDTDETIKEGSSGSPLFDGNEIYGIIVRGNRDEYGNKVCPDEPLNLCFALSSTAILEIIDKHKL